MRTKQTAFELLFKGYKEKKKKKHKTENTYLQKYEEKS